MMLYSEWDEDFKELLARLNRNIFGGDRIAIEPIRFPTRLHSAESRRRARERGILAPGVGFEPTRGASPTGWQGFCALQARSLPDFPRLCALGDPGAFHKS